MTTITLEAIKAEQTRLAAMIATFEAQADQPESIHLPELLIEMQPGERYAGLILGKDGEPSYHLVLLPGQQDDIGWNKAMEWASQQGGEYTASLPTRREQSLLFANLKEEFEDRAYWSCEDGELDASWAWFQYFSDGYQYGNRKGDELRARAVRRLVI